jgi:hypothetical protein
MPALPRVAVARSAARARRGVRKPAVVRPGAGETRVATLQAVPGRAALRTEAPAVLAVHRVAVPADPSPPAVRLQGESRAAEAAVRKRAGRRVVARAVRRPMLPAAAPRAVARRAAEAVPSMDPLSTRTLRRTEALRAARARRASTAISRVSFAGPDAGARACAPVAAARRLTTATGASVTRNVPRAVCARRADASRPARARPIARAVSFVAGIVVPTRRMTTNIALHAPSNARAAIIAPP